MLVRLGLWVWYLMQILMVCGCAPPTQTTSMEWVAAEEKRFRQDVDPLIRCLEAYRESHGIYPLDLSALTDETLTTKTQVGNGVIKYGLRPGGWYILYVGYNDVDYPSMRYSSVDQSVTYDR